MKKLFLVFLSLLTVAMIGVIVYFGMQPKAVLKIKPNQFESLAVAGNSVALNLNDELRATSILVLGINEPFEDSLEVWANTLRSMIDEGGWEFELIIPKFFQEELQRATWLEDLKPSYVEPEHLLGNIAQAREAGKRVLMIMPSVMSSRLGPRQQITELQQEVSEPITTISIVPLAVTRSELSEIPSCDIGMNATSAVSNLACAIQHQSRLLLRKEYSEDQIVGLLAQYGSSEYLYFLHTP